MDPLWDGGWARPNDLRPLGARFKSQEEFLSSTLGCLYSLDWTTGLDYWTDI